MYIEVFYTVYQLKYNAYIYLYFIFIPTVNAPSVNVTSPTTILGSPLNLTCSISLVALLENDVQVEVVWIGPSGSILPEGTMLVGSGTSYISELTLNNLTASDAGSIYTCSVYLNSSLPFVTSSFPVNSSSAISLQSKYNFNNSIT